MFASILITGASGFIGSFLVEEALKRGYDTWAGVRTSSNRKYLSNPDIKFLELDFTNPAGLSTQLSRHKEEYGQFDYIIHCAGVTKTIRKDEFKEVNFLQTKSFVDILIELGLVPVQFIYISTLSVFGPIHEQDMAPIREEDTPQPNTLYGKSKLMAEEYIRSIPGFPYLIFRPTGVYGPREKDYYLMAKSIKNHIDFSAGFKRQDITFVYVKDVVSAVFLGIEKGVRRRAYFLSDNNVYSSRDFSRLIKKELNNPFVIHIKCPLLILKAISLSADSLAKCSGKPGTLNSDKYNIMKQRNWRCDISPAEKELGYKPAYDLHAGVKTTIEWYKKEEWI